VDEAIFAEGVPRRVTVEDVRRWHLASFPDLSEDSNIPIIVEAIEAVYTMFHGCNTIFNMQPPQIWYDKTVLLFRLLVCWYIADQYPMLAVGVPVMGGLPLKAKKIGGVAITFQDNFTRGQTPDYQDLLSGLKSNPWGNKAYLMIRSAVRRVRIGGGRR